jgi:hypothetical protein
MKSEQAVLPNPCFEEEEMVSFTLRPAFPQRELPVPIAYEAGWFPQQWRRQKFLPMPGIELHSSWQSLH